MVDLPPDIAARYGADRTRRTRGISIAIGGLAVVAGVFYGYRVVHSPAAQFALQSFNVVSDTHVDVTWEVSRATGSTTYCVVRAQNLSRQDVGYATVTIAAENPNVIITYPLATESKAVLAEVLGCSDSPIMHVPPANFPPGAAIPPQPAPGVAPAS